MKEKKPRSVSVRKVSSVRKVDSVRLRRTSLRSGFTFVELLFIILVVSLVTVSLSQLFLYSTKSRTVNTETARASAQAETIMEKFIADAQNDPDTFWKNMGNNAVGASYNTQNGDVYTYTYTAGSGCSRLCGSLRVGITMSVGGKEFVKERYFSALPSPTPTITPTPTDTPTPTPTPTDTPTPTPLWW